jgi:hypothetical protein
VRLGVAVEQLKPHNDSGHKEYAQTLAFEVISLRRKLSETDMRNLNTIAGPDVDIDMEDLVELSNARIDSVVGRIEQLRVQQNSDEAARGPTHGLSQEVFELMADNAKLRRTLNDYVWMLAKPVYEKTAQVPLQRTQACVRIRPLTVPLISGS